MDKITSIDIEIAVSGYFDPRRNIIIPNISWGMNLHECDLLILTPAGYLYEVEIKVSKADLKKDLTKRHGHNSDKIKRLYFAIPDHLKDCVDLIPERAGIILVPPFEIYSRCHILREPKDNLAARSLSQQEILNFCRLGVIRIFSLKKRLRILLRENKLKKVVE